MKKRIIWVTNILMPEVSVHLGETPSVKEGWLVGLSEALRNNEDIELCIVTAHNTDQVVHFAHNRIVYYVIPSNKPKAAYNIELELHWKRLNEEFKPDVVHIHGTEFAHGLAYLNACPQNNFVVSMQGLVSVYERYFYAGISYWDFIINTTLRDLLKGTVFSNKKSFRKSGELEKEYVIKSKNVIGRTYWDKIHSLAIDENVNYHFCNEVLRDSFYKHSGTWDINKAERYSVFLSQAVYPIKGLHKAIEALSLLKKKFPQIKIYVAGTDITRNSSSIKERMKISSYGKYIKKLISRSNLKDNVFFTGPLTESEMVSMYKKANAFICPSSIENSPNSIGEAQMIGTPSIASYVGGNMDMVVHGETGFLYRFEEAEMLAYYVNEIFNNDALTGEMSKKASKEALMRHNRETIQNRTLKIYDDVFQYSDLKEIAHN